MDQTPQPSDNASPENVPTPVLEPPVAALPSPVPPPIPPADPTTIPAVEQPPVPLETPAVVPPAVVEPPPTPWWQQAAPIRDAVLAVGAGAYLAGHICLSVQAQQLNVGPVAFPQTQIVAAGIIPALAIAATVKIIGIGNDTANTLGSWVASDSRLGSRGTWHKWKRSWALCLAVLLGFAVTAFISEHPEQFPLSKPVTAIALLTLFFASTIGLSALIRQAWGAMVAEVFPAISPQSLVYSVPFLALFALIASYCSAVLPQLPQEFGGLRPRLAQIDIDAANLSATTRKSLLGVSAPNVGIVSSGTLDVVFAADNCLVVRPHGIGQATTYRIGMESVKAVTWIGYAPLPDATPSASPARPTPAPPKTQTVLPTSTVKTIAKP